MQKEIGIYVHIPFCKSKCIYCDFISYANKDNLILKYMESIKKEIKTVANKMKQDRNRDLQVRTIYIGGGTPSYIDSSYIAQIIEVINNSFNCRIEECTIELNPGTIDEGKLKIYKNIRANRLSIGLQSTKDNILKELGRIHNYDTFLKTYNSARKVGFDNINVDLMIGVPNQTQQDIEDSIENIIELLPEHVSVYSLIVEEGTKMCECINNKVLTLPDEEIERTMYWTVKNKLEDHGYKHYEISNFAKQGYESKHNSDCWNQKEYIGFGVAAHSYFNNTRFSNIDSIEEYINNCEENNLERNVIIHEKQDEENKLREYMILKLRLLEGINIKESNNIFHKNILDVFKVEFKKLLNEKLVCIENGFIRLTNKGLDLANLVWEEFI